jgi:hypothetical protein
MDPTDPDSDPDPQHGLAGKLVCLCTVLPVSIFTLSLTMGGLFM